MASRIWLLAGTLLLVQAGLISPTPMAAQSGGNAPTSNAVVPPAATGPSQITSSHESVPRVPGMTNVFRGFNAGVNYSGVHNSVAGWYSVMTPALSYAFSSHLSADASSTIYFKRKYLTYVAGNPANPQWIQAGATSGDTLFALHAAFAPGSFEEVVTFTLSAPTGDAAAGLGTGRVGYDFANHLEHYHNQLGIFVDVGAGNSSVLFNNVVDRNYSTLGTLAHFMAGADYWFGDRFFVEGLMYEQLPLGTQKLYTHERVRGGPPPPSPYTTISTGANEDNGATAYVGVPLTGNLTLSGYYSHSFRRRMDTVSFGVSWVLKGRKRDSLLDRALEEAERPTPRN